MQPDQMTVVLTGACGGIGQLLARELAAAGASLFLCGRNADTLAVMEKEMREDATGNQLIAARAVDLTDDGEIDSWLESIAETGRPVNVLVNNAGICKFEMFDKLEDRDIEQMMNLNSVVPMKLTRKLLPGLKRQSAARVVNIASTFGAIGFPGYSVYSASKYAIRGFSQALGRELSDTNVRVGCILPRATRTAINSDRVVELNRKMNVAMDPPEKVASAVLKFICGRRGELALGWPEKLLVRINSVFPALVGNAISKKLPLIKRYAA
ncbi:MAG: SDR family oxidoreductase [Gammaproteobacteria bacterium]|nr:SDR family oxidoreductase [Gammaproteobacteria bacterium]